MIPIQFSIVIPLCNKHSNIKRALESVRSQRYGASEIIVIDSVQDKRDVNEITSQDWPELTYVSSKEKNERVMRNLGAQMAKFPFVAFLDPDDQLSPFFLYEIERLIRRFPGNGLYACRYQNMLNASAFKDARIKLTNLDPSGYEMKDYFRIAARGDTPFVLSSMVMLREYFLEIGGFATEQLVDENENLFVQAALDNKIAYSPQIRLYRQIGTERQFFAKQPTGTSSPFVERIQAMIESKFVPEDQVRDAKTFVAAYVCSLVKHNLRAGFPAKARSLLNHHQTSLNSVRLAYWRFRTLMTSVSELFRNQQSTNFNSGV